MSAYSPIKAVDRSRDCFLKLPEVIARTALSRTSIYRKVDRGEFPPPQRLGSNSVAWYESDVLAWMAAPMDWKPAALGTVHTPSASRRYLTETTFTETNGL